MNFETLVNRLIFCFSFILLFINNTAATLLFLFVWYFSLYTHPAPRPTTLYPKPSCNSQIYVFRYVFNSTSHNSKSISSSQYYVPHTHNITHDSLSISADSYTAYLTNPTACIHQQVSLNITTNKFYSSAIDTTFIFS